MIKANELRIGNWVKGHLTGRHLRADWLVMKHMQDGNIQSVYNPEIPVYEPIPLTPEILEKAGFSTDLNGGFFMLGFFSFFLEGDQYIYYDGAIEVHLKWLHQLQNLYFALTGEDLNIEL